MTRLKVRLSSGADAARDDAFVEACCALWLEAFAGHPWHASPDQLPARRIAMRRQMAVEGTQVGVLRDGTGALSGVGWAWPGDCSPDDELHRLVRTALPAHLAEPLWGHEARVLAELMVEPRRHGEGLGSALLDALVGRRDSWLLSHPDGAGLPLYRHRGWAPVGRITRSDHRLLVLARATPEAP